MNLKIAAARLSILAFFYVIASQSTAQDRVPDTAAFTAQLEESIPRLLQESLVPGAAVALIKNGEVIYKRGFGFADVAHQRPVTAQTGFNIGSISKTVAAWGVMHLVEQGKIDLDKPVSTYLKRWHLPEATFDANGVTVRRLLSHTAGLSLHGYPGFGPDDELPSIEASLGGATNGSGDVRLIMEPGTKWKYSGGGYTILQLLIEEISGQSFADYMRSNVLQPLGMRHSDYHLSEAILAGSSICYDGWGEPTPNPRFTAQAAAGLHTTIEDLATFAAAALKDGHGRPPGRALLKPETLAAMLAPAPASEDTYGLGYGVQLLPDGSTANGHGGANRGWYSYMQFLPASGYGFAMVTNGSNGYAVINRTIDLWVTWIAGKPPARPSRTPISIPLKSTLMAKDAAAAIAQYRDLKKNHPEDYGFGENELNLLGYELMGRNRLTDAIEILKLNVEAFPDSANPYDSLGEAYMTHGDKELAITNYKKSLELNPQNTNAEQMLQKLAQK